MDHAASSCCAGTGSGTPGHVRVGRKKSLSPAWLSYNFWAILASCLSSIKFQYIGTMAFSTTFSTANIWKPLPLKIISRSVQECYEWTDRDRTVPLSQEPTVQNGYFSLFPGESPNAWMDAQCIQKRKSEYMILVPWIMMRMNLYVTCSFAWCFTESVSVDATRIYGAKNTNLQPTQSN